MSDRDALMRATVNEPDEDTPRLVLADWYEENEDAARAEFIRDSVELERLRGMDHTSLLPADQREKLHRLDAKVAATLHDPATRAAFCTTDFLPDWAQGTPEEWAQNMVPHRFHRGLPYHVEGTVAQLLHSPDLFALNPIQSIRIRQFRGRQMDELLTSPLLPRLRELHLINATWLGAQVGALARCEALSGLQVIDVSNTDLDSEEFLSLLNSPHLKGLHSFRMHDNAIGSEAVEALIQPRLTPLQVLDLRENALENEDLIALAGASALKQLRTLLVAHQHPVTHLDTVYAPEVTDAQAAAALAHSPYLANLRDINLTYEREFVQALVACWAAKPESLAGRPSLFALERINGKSLEAIREQYHLPTDALGLPPGPPPGPAQMAWLESQFETLFRPGTGPSAPPF